MKRTAAKGTVTALLVALLTALVTLFGVHTPSSETADGGRTDLRLTSDETATTYIVKDGKSDYNVVFSVTDSLTADASNATALRSRFANYGIYDTRAIGDSASEEQYEILLGETNRSLSEELAAAMREAEPEGGYAWAIAEKDGKIAFVANCDAAFERGVTELFACFGETEASIPTGTWRVSTVTAEQLDAEMGADRLAQIEHLKELIGAFRDEEFGTATMMDTELYDDPLTYPTVGQHPRLNLTADMIPDILAVLEDPAYSKMAEEFWELANEDFDGKLVAPAENKSNYNGRHHAIIEAKALAYLLTGDKLYGYEAIYAAKNYMLTIVIRHNLASDIFRGWGRIMTVMGEVYDWCYDLMTERDKAQFVAGVEWKLCRDCTCGSGDKMTIGFPPTGHNAVQGHGTNVALMRDYLGFAIAVFDERPDWWELIGGRFYEEYVPANNVFYPSAMNTQGTGNYLWGKFYAQLHSAWLVKVMSGEMPYDPQMESVVYGLMGLKMPNGKYFQSGDGGGSPTGAGGRVTHLAVAAALFPSEILKYHAYVYTEKYTLYDWGISGSMMTPSLYSIFLANGYEGEAVTSATEGLDLVWYYSYPSNMMAARDSWESDAAAVYMKIGGLSAGNHDHEDAGTFQIYYKGCFTSESGQYGTGAGYGTICHSYWTQATISHNGLLVYNPALSASDKGWYSGGQRSHPGPNVVSDWLTNDEYKMGSVTGSDYYYDPADGSVEFAYLAGDITVAYDSATVDTIERRMLTVYTDNEEFPMFFTVYDYMKSKDASFKKSFLMHTVTEPTIDGNVATYVQNEGKIVLTTLTDGAVMNKIGGPGKTYWINDTVGNLNIAEEGGGTAAGKGDSDTISDGALWGRVQIDNVGKTEDHLLNVFYVTDAANENTLTPEKFENDLVIGMQMEDVIAAFSKGLEKSRQALSFRTEGVGLFRYFVSGLSEGTWTVKVDDIVVAHAYTSNDSGIIDFVAPAGSVSVEPGKDVRPANSDEVIYYTNGGILPEDTQYFYTHDVEFVLPVIEDTEDMIFAGWYASESSNDRIYTLPAGTRGTVKVYARFCKTYLLDFENMTLNVQEKDSNKDGYSYRASNKTGASFVTVDDPLADNTYLLWTAGERDPQFDQKGSIASVVASSAVLSFEIDVALNGENPPIASSFRLRGPSSKNTTSPFTVTSTGDVLLGGNSSHKFLELTQEFGTVRISIDFENMLLYAFDSDGNIITQKALTLAKVDSALSGIEYMQTCSEYIFNWYSGAGQAEGASLRIDNVKTYSGFVAGARLPDDTHPQAIIYNNLGTVSLPYGTQYTYDPAGKTPLPVFESTSGKIFAGWYTEPEFINEVTAVPPGTTGQYNVYAKWFSILEEDYEAISMDYANTDGTVSNKTVNGIEYRLKSKLNSAYKTVTDPETENTYLVWTEGENDPQINVNASLADFLGAETAFTVSVDIAKNGDAPIMSSEFRIRVSGSNAVNLFTVTSDGEVRLLGQKSLTVGTLSESFTTFTFMLDFKNSMAAALDANGDVTVVDGTPILSAFGVPSAASGCETTLDWMKTLTNYYFVWYATSAADAPASSMKIDNLRMVAGGTVPEVKNGINYVNVDASDLPSDAPKFYDTEHDTPLPVLNYSTRGIFKGWYSDPELTNEITSIPAGEGGEVSVYAGWLAIVSEDYETTVIDKSNSDGTGNNFTAGEYYYRMTDKLGVSYKTVTDPETENTYLVWVKGSADPQIEIARGLSDFLGSETAFTFSVDIARDGDAPMLESEYRIRVTGSNAIKLFTVSANGDVRFLGNESLVVANIGSEFTTLTFTVDFATGVASALDKEGNVLKTEDGTALTATLSVPKAAQDAGIGTMLEWLATINRYCFVWYGISNSDAPDSAMRIDNMVFKAGA